MSGRRIEETDSPPQKREWPRTAASPIAMPATICTIAITITAVGAAEMSRAAAINSRAPTMISGSANTPSSTRTGTGSVGAAEGVGTGVPVSLTSMDESALQPDDRAPLLRDQCVACGRRMHTVLRQRLGTHLRGACVERCLERHKAGVHGGGDARRRRAPLIERREP